MTSIPQPGGGQDPNLPECDALIAAAERIACQEQLAKQLRRARRRAKHAKDVRVLRARSRAGFFWIGNSAFAAAMVCFLTGETAMATELVKLALAAWLAAIQLPPQN
ncbi:hypothetical protein [Streptomyces violascens]|uniref:hypothetical protein n=1 Tax=Streptomyces violascens TaxID=67381 RepID=UPI0036653158